MPLRKPTTRRSPRMPKNKESKVDEGSTPSTARKLDFVSNMESVNRTSSKKEFSQPLAFGDT